ncbi:MAG: Crp/Fnr family transcriptional regulator [Desulfotomaculum sp.]|nr:Crp/Fnr family transcriptional regulator [Desulfotomaculum sp.]
MKQSSFKNINLFESVSPEQIKQYQPYFQERSFKRKDIIFYPGKYPQFIFFILQGKLRVFLSYAEGKEFTLTVLEAGDVYSGHTRAYGQALSDIKLALIPVEIFKEMLVDIPGLVFDLVAVLGDALKGSINAIESLVFEEAGMRLTSLLMEWARQSGQVTDEGIFLKLDFTREEIATMIGSSRQTLATLFKELSKAGLIKLKQKDLIIKDLQGLNKFYK